MFSAQPGASQIPRNGSQQGSFLRGLGFGDSYDFYRVCKVFAVLFLARGKVCMVSNSSDALLTCSIETVLSCDSMGAVDKA